MGDAHGIILHHHHIVLGFHFLPSDEACGCNGCSTSKKGKCPVHIGLSMFLFCRTKIIMSLDIFNNVLGYIVKKN